MATQHRQPGSRKNSIRALFRSFFAAGVAGALALGGCGGGSGMSSTPTPASANTGAAMITITDAPGDFLSYMVNVVSIKLTRADGTVVETLPVTTQVDFAQLVNLSEIISAKQIPEGSYTAASMTLDYTGATVVIDNGGTGGGIVVPAANLLNGGSNAPLVAPNNQMTLSLQLPAGQPLVITQGTIANLALDFNLAASNTVAPAGITTATPASAVTVTVNPVLTASLAPDATKQIRVRGPIVSVGASSYTIKLRPFYDSEDSDDQLTVNVAAATTYTINGATLSGSAGLTALAALPVGTLTVAMGSFDVGTRSFTASAVYAGSSVPGAGLDSIEGTVVARTGNVLTLADGLIHHGDDDMAMYGGGSVAVTVAATTMVSEDGQTGTFGPQNISVGQHAQLFGTLGTDGSGNRTLDASQGSARLMITSLTGQVVSSAAGSVTLSLQAIDGRPAAAFNFAGTGTASAQDATAAGYVVSVPSALALPTPTAGAPISFTGFPTPFGSAPPDFTAVTLVNYANAAARFNVQFESPGVAAPFTTPLSATGLVMTQATLQSADESSLVIGFQVIHPGTLATGVTFTPDDSATAATSSAFAILHRSTEAIDTYSSFADLVAALGTDLNGTVALQGMAAEGPFDSTTGMLSTDKLLVVLSD